MASQFKRSEELLEQLIDSIDDVLIDIPCLKEWQDEDFENVAYINKSLRELEIQTNRYRKNLAIQCRDPEMTIYGPKMVLKLENFLLSEERISSIWEEQVNSRIEDELQQWQYQKRKLVSARIAEEKQDYEQRILNGRAQTQAEEETRKLLLEDHAKERREKELRRKEVERERLANIAAESVREAALKLWVEEEVAKGLEGAYERAGNYLMAAVESTNDEHEANLNALEPLIHIDQLLAQIIGRPGAAEGGLKTRILREGNRLFTAHFKGMLDGTRALLLIIGFRPLYSRSGADQLINLLNHPTDGDVQMKNALINFIKMTETVLPQLEGVVWWYLPEPLSSISSFDTYKNWLNSLRRSQSLIKELIHKIRTNMTTAELS